MIQQRVEKIDRWRYELISQYCLGHTLDVACGLKGLSNYLSPHQYIGCDLGGGDVQCSAYALPFKDKQFGTVIMGEMLEHLGMPLAALQEAGRVAQRRIVVTVPNNYSLVKLGRLLLGREVEIEPEHILSYNAWNLARLFEQIGFHLIESFCYPLRLQLFPEIPIRSRFDYWLFCIADVVS